MNREEWESLISTPGWDAMKRYLADYRLSMMEGMAEGNVPAEKMQETIVRCQTAKDLAEMDWATVAKFYNIEDDPKERPYER